MASEARYQKQLMDRIRERGGWVVKYPAGPHGTIGTPDLLVCYLGHFLAIEVKAGNPRLKRYEPTPMQARQLDGVREAGGVAIIAWPDGPDIDRLLDTIELLDAAVGTLPAG